jgi:hypothetical protein
MNVFIHIPKTAGTFLGYLFDHGSGRRIFWDYSADYSTALVPDPDVVASADFISRWFWGIHGHFFYTKYADVFPQARFMTCVRHPVDRVVSQFKHEVYDAVCHESVGGLAEDNPKSRGLLEGCGLIDWLMFDPSVGNAQVNHLSGRRLEDYDFLFVQEMLVPCWAMFREEFSFSRGDPLVGTFPSINSAEDRKFGSEAQRHRYKTLTEIPRKDLEQLFLLIPEEVAIYEAAVRLVTERLERRSA